LYYVIHSCIFISSRTSTQRGAQISVAQDGFVFRRKRKAAPNNAAADDDDDDVKHNEESSPFKQHNLKRRKNSKKLGKAPAYPTTDVDTPNYVNDKGDAPEVALTRFLESAVTSELEAVQSTFVDDFDFVGKAIADVCNDFLKNVQVDHVVRSIEHLPKEPMSDYKNDANLDLEAEDAVLKSTLDGIQKEIDSWNTVQKAAEAINTTTTDVSDDEAMKLLDDSQRAMLSESVGGKLGTAVPKAFETFAIHTDSILTSLRKMSKWTQETAMQHKKLAHTISQKTAKAYKPNANPKDLIAGILTISKAQSA
jgi:hypothetical protein